VTDYHHLMLLTAAWLVYFLIHSLLASLRLKRWLASHYPAVMPWYRLVFNMLAVLLLALPLWLLFSVQAELVINWSGYAQWLSHALALAAVAGFFWSTRFYDSSEFIGTRQLKADLRQAEDQETFHLSPLHRYVRHPWYFLALVLIWTRDMDIYFLTSAVLMTLYFIMGSRLEEKKLVEYHGETYRQYCQRVPGLLPLPWKYLTPEQADKLLESIES